MADKKESKKRDQKKLMKHEVGFKWNGESKTAKKAGLDGIVTVEHKDLAATLKARGFGTIIEDSDEVMALIKKNPTRKRASRDDSKDDSKAKAELKTVKAELKEAKAEAEKAKKEAEAAKDELAKGK